MLKSKSKKALNMQAQNKLQKYNFLFLYSYTIIYNHLTQTSSYKTVTKTPANQGEGSASLWRIIT